jgi:hypothetical protein
MINTVTDLATKFNIELFSRRQTIIDATVSGDSPMPAMVTATLLHTGTDKPLATALQPEVSINARVIRFVFSGDVTYPALCKIRISFDGQPVLFGQVSVSTKTIDSAQSSPVQVVINLAGEPVPVVFNLPDNIAVTDASANRAEAAADRAEGVVEAVVAPVNVRMAAIEVLLANITSSVSQISTLVGSGGAGITSAASVDAEMVTLPNGVSIGLASLVNGAVVRVNTTPQRYFLKTDAGLQEFVFSGLI